MGCERIVPSINWSQGIPNAMRGCLYYVKEGKVTLPTTELIGTTVQQLQSQPWARVNVLDNSLVELQAPLSLLVPNGPVGGFFLKSILATLTMLIVGSVLKNRVSSSTQEEQKWTVKKVAALVGTLFAGAAVFYFVGTTRLFHTRVEFFPPKTIFQQSWLYPIQVVPG
jgi:hypothetical protein